MNIKTVTYLRVKNAFSVNPEQAVATAKMKVVTPKVEWMGTKLALNEAVADSQQSNNRKLKKPTTNWKMKKNLNYDFINDANFFTCSGWVLILCSCPVHARFQDNINLSKIFEKFQRISDYEF
jgi:hypothetical protein